MIVRVGLYNIYCIDPGVKNFKKSKKSTCTQEEFYVIK